LAGLEPHQYLAGVDRQRLFAERTAITKVDPAVDRVTADRRPSAASACFRAVVECGDLQVLVAESGPLHVQFEVVQDDLDGLSALNGQAPATVGVEEVLARVVGTGDVAVVVEDDRTATLLLCRLRCRR